MLDQTNVVDAPGRHLQKLALSRNGQRTEIGQHIHLDSYRKEPVLGSPPQSEGRSPVHQTSQIGVIAGTLASSTLSAPPKLLQLKSPTTYLLATNAGPTVTIRGRFDNRGVRIRVPSGGMVIVPPASEIECYWRGSGFHFINLHLPSQCLERAAGIRRSSPGKTKLQAAVVSQPTPQLWHLVHALREELARDRQEHSSLGEHLAVGLGLCLLAEFEGTAEEVDSHRGLSRTAFRRVTAFIEARIGEPLSLTALAEIADLSVFHFARMFKQSTGYAPHRFIIQARITRAKRLLTTGSLSIADLAHQLGFCSQSHFGSFFRRWEGCTPIEYRRRHKT